MNYARFYYQDYFPDINGKFIYVDDDCIVQGQLFLIWFDLSKENKKLNIFVLALENAHTDCF